MSRKNKKGKKEKKEKEPQYYISLTNVQNLNYKIYYMKPIEKILYIIIAFIVGATIGFLFYGGIGKDEYGQNTATTNFLNVFIPVVVGLIAVKIFIPSRRESLKEKRKRILTNQFRDMLDGLATSLGAGENITDAFVSVQNSLKLQYDSDAYILQEIEIILSGIKNNVNIEEILSDFGKRSGVEDIQSFADVFKTSYRKGGNLKDNISKTNRIICDKIEINDEINTMVASNKMEQKIMIAMPIALVAVIKMMSPEFAANFVTPAGLVSTTVAIALFVFAYFMAKAVLNIKV